MGWDSILSSITPSNYSCQFSPCHFFVAWTSLSRTTQQIAARFDELVRAADEGERRSRPIDVDTVDALEELLISADVGVAATARIIAAVKTRARNGQSLRDLVKQEIRGVFAAVDRPVAVAHHPKVILIVGVNGTGKTTTVGKLANRLKSDGEKPLICAADTFRAAAVEQLEIWAARAGVDLVRAREGADPAAVVFDAITSGKRKAAIRFSSTPRAGCTRAST